MAALDTFLQFVDLYRMKDPTEYWAFLHFATLLCVSPTYPQLCFHRWKTNNEARRQTLPNVDILQDLGDIMKTKSVKFIPSTPYSSIRLDATNTVVPILLLYISKPVRRHVWRWTSERERDRPVFGVGSMSGLSGFRDNETGDARANVQSHHLRLS